MATGQPQAVNDDPLAPLASALFRPMGLEGVYARSALFTRVLTALEAYISGLSDPNAEVMQFPPVMSREQLERSGYLSSFPNLLGCVCALHGTDASIRATADEYQAGGDWTRGLTASDMVLTPAACYPVYPMVALRGRLPLGGLQFDIEADCFRREPSPSLSRLQAFRMREFVRIGNAEEIIRFRAEHMERAPLIAADLCLPYSIEVANDPFFGPVGHFLGASQRHRALKFELLIPFHPGGSPTACMSFNYHRDHFGEVWNIQTADGVPAHTGCVAFGLDRLAVALFAVHGLAIERWPDQTRQVLSV